MLEKKKYIVNKFGGAIMSSKSTLENAKNNIVEQIESGFAPVVVVSAFKDVTDEIEKVFKEIFSATDKDIDVEKFSSECLGKIIEANNAILEKNDFDNEILELAKNDVAEIYHSIKDDIKAILSYGMLDVFSAKILSSGEKISSIYFKYFLERNGLKTKRFSGESLGIITDNNFLDADIDFDISSKNVLLKINEIDEYTIPIITGFSGKTISGQTSTLGRGGSDTTATFLGVALKAEKIILWKNVAGVLSADPFIVKNAKTVKNISYSQAEETGKVICVKAMKYIKMSEIPCEVAYINDKNQKTLIEPQDNSNKKGMKIVGVKRNLILLKFKDESIVKHGFLATIAEVVGGLGINMVFIRNTKEMIYIVVENVGIEKLNKMFGVFKNKGIEVSFDEVNIVIGIGNFEWEDVKKFNDVLYESGIEIIIGAFPYKNNVRLESVIIGDKKEVDVVLEKLHNIT